MNNKTKKNHRNITHATTILLTIYCEKNKIKHHTINHINFWIENINLLFKLRNVIVKIDRK